MCSTESWAKYLCQRSQSIMWASINIPAVLGIKQQTQTRSALTERVVVTSFHFWIVSPYGWNRRRPTDVETTWERNHILIRFHLYPQVICQSERKFLRFQYWEHFVCIELLRSCQFQVSASTATAANTFILIFLLPIFCHHSLSPVERYSIYQFIILSV